MRLAADKRAVANMLIGSHTHLNTADLGLSFINR